MESDISSVSAVLRKAAYLLLLVGFACFIVCVGVVGRNLDKPSRPIEKVALAASVMAFVLGVVCVIGAGPEAFGRRYPAERRRQYDRSALASLAVTVLFGLLFIEERLRRDYGRPGGLQELFRALLPWLLLAGATALIGGVVVVLLRSLAEAHSGSK